MNINPITSTAYRNTYCSNKSYVTSPSFRGALNDNSAKRVLEMLKPKISSVKVSSDFADVRTAIDTMIQKWNGVSKTTNSVGIMVIPAEEIVDFIAEKGKNIVTSDKVGICVAVGDKYAPIEKWNECYDATVVLIPEFKYPGTGRF